MAQPQSNVPSQVEATRPRAADQGEHRPAHRLLHRLQLPHPYANLRGAGGEQIITTGKYEFQIYL